MNPAFRDWPALAADYARWHRHPLNKALHRVGIPLLLLGLTAWSRVPALGPVPLLAAFLPVYAAWDLRLAVLLGLELAGLAWLAGVLPGWAPAAAFAAGFFLQYAGHAWFERESPAFTRNLLHLLVGPAWVAAEPFGLVPEPAESA